MGNSYWENGPRSLTILQEEAEKRLGKDFPSLSYDKLLVVDTSTERLAIDDVSYKAIEPVEEAIGMMQLACNGELDIYDAPSLTFALAKKIERFITVVNPRKTIAIFPGEGSKVVQELLPEGLLDGVTSVNIPTQRTVDTKGLVQGVNLTDANKIRQACAAIKPETVLVIDDVITTGLTIQKVQEATPGRKMEWYAAALMALSPTQRKNKANNAPSGVVGYNGIIVPIVYQGITGMPALNSLSTLVGNSAKSLAVREKYMSFVNDRDIFLQSAQQVGRSLKR